MTNIVNEEQFHAECAQWFHNEFRTNKMLVTVDNNVSKRLPPYLRVIEGNRKKALGVQPGATDMFYVGYYFVHFIELKMWDGVQSKDQEEFQRQVEERHHRYYIVHCLKPGVAVDQITNFIALILQIFAMEEELKLKKHGQ